MPPQQQQAPSPADRPHNFLGYVQRVLDDEFLNAGNPHLEAAVIDPLRRESQTNIAAERLRLNQAAGGAGRFGGDVWQNLQGRATASNEQNLMDAINAAYFQNYGQERGLQQAAAELGAGYVGQQETAQLQAETQLEIAAQQLAAQRAAAAAASSAAAGRSANSMRIAELQAQTQMEMLAAQLGFNREELAGQLALGLGAQGLSSAQLAQQGELGVLGLLSQLGLGAGQNQLGALGLSGMLEGAGYGGLQAAAGLTGQSLAAQMAAAAAGHGNQMNQWQWEYGSGLGALQNFLGLVGPIAGMGGSATGTQPGQQVPPGAPAWAQGLTGFLGGVAGAGELFGGSDWWRNLFGGGSAPPPQNPQGHGQPPVSNPDALGTPDDQGGGHGPLNANPWGF